MSSHGVYQQSDRTWDDNNWSTCRWNRNFHFGIKFWLSTSGALALLFALSVHYSVVRDSRRFYLMIALVATLQERADATFTRGVLRAVFAAVAGTLGGHDVPGQELPACMLRTFEGP